MTRREFIIEHKAYERGKIDAWKHIINTCRMCIKAHREGTTKNRLEQIADINRHLWRDK